MAVPMALGAADPGQAPSEVYARIGQHRLLPNSLVLDGRGEVLVLNYHESGVPLKIGMVTVMGSISATPLREVLQRVQDPANTTQNDLSRAPAPTESPRRRGNERSADPRKEAAAQE
jgi:hypothetical protein